MTEPSISIHPLHHFSPNLELSCLSQPLSPMSSLVFPYLCSPLQSYPYSSSPNHSPPSSTHAVRRYSCTVYIVVVVCNVSSLYKSQERRLSHCCSTTLQPATGRVKYIIIFGQIIYIFSQRGLGPTSFRADNAPSISACCISLHH